MVIRAKYENGIFKPLGAVNLKEGTILEIYVPTENGIRPCLSDFAFIGMWEERSDVPDGLSYVDRLRDNPRN